MKKTIIMYGCFALAFFGPLVGWIMHNAVITHPDSNVLGWATFAAWSGACVIAGFAFDNIK